MTRSTEECEISRSCHSAIFSNAACAFARTTRASPQICSLVIGLRLVRHRRRALLALRERLLGFPHFGALQMADFERDFFERCRQ